MADSTIHALTDGVSPQTTDEIAVARSPFGAGDDRKLTVAELDGRYGLGLHTVAASGSNLGLDVSTANVWDVTLSSSCTFTLAGFTAGVAQYLTLVLRQDSTGSRTVTWPTITWIGSGVAPSLQTAASAVDSVVLFSFDGGTNVYGVAQTSASGLASGTSFPGSPSDGNLFYRTDRRILYEYDIASAKWLSLDRKYVQFGAPLVADQTTAGQIGSIPVFEDMYVESLQCTTRVQTTNNGSNYWDVNLYTETPAIAVSSIAAMNTASDTVNIPTLHSVNVGVVVAAATYVMLALITSKAGAPGGLILSPLMVVRSVG